MRWRVGRPYLVEANVLRLLPEALTAQVEAVLPDETGPVLADTAIHPRQHPVLMSLDSVGSPSWKKAPVPLNDSIPVRKSLLLRPSKVHAPIAEPAEFVLPSNRGGVDNGGIVFLPAARALAVVPGVRVPEILVSHFDGCLSICSSVVERGIGGMRGGARSRVVGWGDWDWE